MATLSKDVVIRLLGESASAEKAIKAAADAAEISVTSYRKAERAQAQQTKAAEEAARKQAQAWQTVGVAVLGFGAAVAAGLGYAGKQAMDWESAWAGVTKTVSGTPEQLAAVEAGLRQLSRELPSSHAEIAAVAEAAGQLGVQTGSIVEFTRTMINLGQTTNLSAEEAATGLAQLMNVMGTAPQDVGRLGAALVALGNDGASTEADILRMAGYITGSAKLIGASESDVLALANAMTSMGINAERGGGVMTRVMQDIYAAVQNGGDELDAFAEVAGMSAQDFATAFRNDPVRAIDTFIQGLSRVEASGGNVVATLGELGYKGTQDTAVLLQLKGAGDLLVDSLDLGNQAWAENTALVAEAAKRYETTQSKVQMARNAINDAAIDFGAVLLPVLADVLTGVGDLARGFGEMPDWLQTSIVVLGVVAATIGLVGGAAVIATPKLMAFRASMADLTTSSSGAATAVGRFGLFMSGPWGAAIGLGVTLLGGLVAMLGASSRASDEARAYQQALKSALQETNGVINENVRAVAAKEAAERSVGNSTMLDVAEDLGIALPRVTDALLGNRDAYDELLAAANAVYDQSLLQENAGDAEWTERAENARLFISALQELAPQMALTQEQLRQEAAATEASGEAADGAATAVEGQTGAVSGLGDAADDAQEALDALVDALENLNKPTLDLRDAENGFYEAIDRATQALAENGQNLDVTTEKGRANRSALDDMAQASMDYATAILNSTGNQDMFRSSLDNARASLFDQATAFGMTDEEAQAYIDTVLAIPPEAETTIGLPGQPAAMAGLRDVFNAVVGIPPDKPVNVRALTSQATQMLRDLGFTVQTLPDGTVNITANTSAAVSELNAFLSRPAVKTVRIVTDSSGATVGRDFSNGTQARASGGPVWPGELFLVGEEGPEFVRFPRNGTVMPADETARLMAAMRGSASVLGSSNAVLSGATGGAVYGGATYNQQRSRTYAPQVTVYTTGQMTEKQLLDRLRDDEYLHG